METRLIIEIFQYVVIMALVVACTAAAVVAAQLSGPADGPIPKDSGDDERTA